MTISEGHSDWPEELSVVSVEKSCFDLWVTTERKVFEQAMKLLREGHAVEAEGLLEEAQNQVKAEFGENSTQLASALADRAMFLASLQDIGRAVQYLRQACAIDAPGEQAFRDRLTNLMNLGDLLRVLGEFEDAERVLRLGLQGRSTFYGETHAGYAFGLEPLAAVLSVIGRDHEALELIEKAIGILKAVQNPQLVSALATRSTIAVALGKEPFDDLEYLTEEQFTRLLIEISSRVGDVDAVHQCEAMDSLDDIICKRFGETSVMRIRLATDKSEVARQGGLFTHREAALTFVYQEYLRRNERKMALEALLGLALAYSDTGHLSQADETYQECEKLARAIGDSAYLAKTLRNTGIFYSENAQLEKAEKHMSEAVVLAKQAGDRVKLGEAQVALGIFQQHHGRPDEAKILLESGIELLDPAHPHALMARSHLTAIVKGKGCGCGDMSGAIGQALEELVMPHIPKGLIDSIQVTIRKDGSPHVNVTLERALSNEEKELLDRVINQALNELRHRGV